MGVTGLIGAQYGSEGKGAIAGAIANAFDIHVRTGAPNAGHTVWHQGREWKMRSIPCGWVNPDAMLVIGAGGLVDLHVLREEVWALEAAGYNIKGRLLIDRKCSLVSPIHRDWEGGTEGYAHEKIGSTGEGVGPARMAKIARGTWGNSAPLAVYEQMAQYKSEDWQLGDTALVLNKAIDEGAHVLLEGTQGAGLSLTHGEWPYVTSCDTNAAQLAADAGIAPKLVRDVILVARTFPIRVAGNSGPLRFETSWAEMGLPEERTTVTRKVRRVGGWDWQLVERACLLNRPTCLALTFVDYLDSEAHGKTSFDELPDSLVRQVLYLEERLRVPVGLLGTGPDTVITLSDYNGVGIGRRPRFLGER